MTWLPDRKKISEYDLAVSSMTAEMSGILVLGKRSSEALVVSIVQSSASNQRMRSPKVGPSYESQSSFIRDKSKNIFLVTIEYCSQQLKPIQLGFWTRQ